MGNKSKTNGKKQSQKWAQRRDMVSAGGPGWRMAGPQEEKKLPVLHDSSRLGTKRNAKPLNSQTGV